MANLLMHCGGRHVTRPEIINCPTPERTESWVPVPHYNLLQVIERTIGGQGFRITNQAHGLWGEGARYFGLLELADQALNQAKKGRAHILAHMMETLDMPRPYVSQYAPRIEKIMINPDKIGAVIGKGGEMINKITSETGAEIDIKEDGTIFMTGTVGYIAEMSVAESFFS